MADLKHWQKKLQEKAKNMSFRDFVKMLGSRSPVTFYKNQSMISSYPDVGRINTIVSSSSFQQERDNYTTYGTNYNFDVDFFTQFQSQQNRIPYPNMFTFGQIENADYANVVINSRNAYLSQVVVSDSQNVCYSFSVKDKSTNVLNSIMVRDNNDNIYQSVGVINSYNIFYSKYIQDSADTWFSTNLVGCHHCLLCEDLQGKSYCIRNEQYTKEEYMTKKDEILSQKEQYLIWYQKLSNISTNTASNNVQGSSIIKSENVADGYFVYQVKEGRNIFLIGGAEGDDHMYNGFIGGAPASSHFYNIVLGGFFSEHIYNTVHFDDCNNLYYCTEMLGCSYCLGCIGLKNKQFCIFNKQYEKEERLVMIDKIFGQMEQNGILGKFFPGSINPYYFNDTIAYLIDDTFTKEEVEKDGYLRRDQEIKVDIPSNVEVIDTKNLDIVNYDESILKKVIRDEKGNYYRIVKMEYDFLKKHDLPLPNLHRMDRLKMNFRLSS